MVQNDATKANFMHYFRNGFFDDLNSDFSSSSNFNASESEGKCYVDFSCNNFSKNSK